MGVLIAFVAALVRSGAALLPATVGYAAAYDSGSAVVGIVCAALAGGLLCVTHALPVVFGRLTAERQFVLGLILVYLGDALSRLFGQPYVGHASTALDARFNVPLLADLPVLGEMLFQQKALVYRTRLGLHLRAIGEEPSAADALGVSVDLYRFGAVLAGGLLMGFAGGVLSLSTIGAWTEGLTGGRGWIALGLVTFANWHPLWAIAGTMLFGGFEAAQFRLPTTFPGAQYLFGILPYLAPIVTLPLITARMRGRSAAPAALGQPYFREARG
jgi:general nucleoside transport system permease protein